MALNIDDLETERLARKLAQLTGESIHDGDQARHRGAIGVGLAANLARPPCSRIWPKSLGAGMPYPRCKA
jgi:hypothetical protein